MVTSRRQAFICVGAETRHMTLIEKAQRLGFETIVIDSNPNAPGFRLASERICLNPIAPNPVPKLVQLARRFDIHGVATRASGPAVVTTAQIAAALHLPGPTIEAAEIMLGKPEFLDRCRSFGIAAPVQFEINSAGEGSAEVNFPCIIKSGYHAQLVRDREQLVKSMTHFRAKAPTTDLLAESFAPGFEFLLLAFVRDDRLAPLALLDRINCSRGNGRIIHGGFAAPSFFSGTRVENKIHQVAQRLIEAFNPGTAPFLLSCRCKPKGEPVVTDLHLGLGEPALDVLLALSSGFDYLNFALQILSSASIPVPQPHFTPAKLLFTSAFNRRKFSERCLHNGRNYFVIAVQDTAVFEKAFSG